MENVFETLFSVYIIISIVALILYIPRLSYYITGFKKQKHPTNEEKNKLAIIIPARDESSVIGNLFTSINRQTYDRSDFDIHVVVADKNDKTIELTKVQSNALVHVVENQTCKGEALDSCLKDILRESPDKYNAYIIVDADNLMSENFLEEMNNALSSGNQIILGRKRIKNWESKNKKSRSWVSNCTALTYIFIDQMGNAFRTKHKIPCNLCGTGMLVRADVIKELGGWPYRTLTEDYEMLMDCILKGFTSMYYKYADVYTEEATAHKVANGRRLRWITGYAQCNKIYGKRIKEKTFDGNKIEWKNFDFLYGLVPVYIFFGISVAVALIGIVSALVLFILKNPVWILALQKGVYALALVYLVLWVYTLIGLVIDREMMKMTFMEKLTVLFVNPIFFSEYLPIFIKAFTKDDDFSWEKVDRIVFDSMEEQLWQLQKKNS